MNSLQPKPPHSFLTGWFAILLLAAWFGFAIPVPAQSVYSQAYTFTTFAGVPGIGTADGVGDEAHFYLPGGVTVDKAGNIYVADTYNYTIRKLTPAGVVTTIAGFPGQPGELDGTNSAARFENPYGVAVDSASNLFVADSFSGVRKITPEGTNWVVTTIFGPESRTNPVQAVGTAVDNAGIVYVLDGNVNTIHKLAYSGTNWLVTTLEGTLAHSGYTNGLGTNALFNAPYGIAVDSASNVFVADTGSLVIQEVSPQGAITTIAGNPYSGQGLSNGIGTNALFSYPQGIAVDSADNLYVADTGNNMLRKIVPAGSNWLVSTLAGQLTSGSGDGTGTNAFFARPVSLALDTNGNIYVADMNNESIRKVSSAAVVSTLAGTTGQGNADGVGNEARFNGPYAVAADTQGNLYVSDAVNNTIRKVTSAAEVSTLAGLAGSSGSTNGAGSEARFNFPTGIALDGTGNVYVVDTYNYTIREITAAGVVTTIAGRTGYSGSADGTGTNAQFNFGSAQLNLFSGITVDGATNLYVVDAHNSTIRKISPVGTNWMVSTIAGSVGNTGSSNGVGTNAMFYFPGGITVDGATNLYVADTFNEKIRKISPVGTNWVVSTIASGINYAPEGIAVDGAGNLFVVINNGQTIQKLTPAGTNWLASTIGGVVDALLGGSSDGAGSAATFNNPMGVAVDSAGNVYVADTGNNTIRKGSFTQFASTNVASFVQPPMTGQLQVTLLPPAANGQWRFPWELTWRASGSLATNLVPGSYAVEFRSLPGYLPVPPNFDSVAVSASGVTSITNQYYPTLNVSGTTNTGGLTVFLAPNLVTGSGWRFIGESTYRSSGATVTNLVPDTYFIEFAPVSGFSQPASQAVAVYASEVTSVSVNYTLAQSAPASVLSSPVPVGTNEIGDLTDYPFGFNGQLQTDVGYGSGVAVSTNVVLTAAHLVFNDETLSYVNQAYWFWQQEPGSFTEVPQQAEGWYVLSGYAAQRTNDLLGGFAPDQSSPQSRNLDVAALYFDLPVAGGSYGGCLPSDAQPNTWLTSTANKMLVGYPVDGSVFGVSVTNGQMYEVGPQPYPLNEATDVVTNQQEVYEATWFLSYPGNSGGPFYVQYNGYYYPAGVYLGTLYNGIQPYASLVRGIDSNVVNLINLAAALGSGTNNSGGVILLVPSANISASNPGRIILQLGPPAAVAEGAAWELAGDASYSTAINYVRAVTTTNAISLVFKPIPGWTVPPSQNLSVTPNNTTLATATYTASSPTMLAVDSSLRLGLSGTVGTTYAIQSRISLTSGSWTNVSTNTIATSGFNLTLPKPATGQTIFYRAVWLGY